MPAAPDFDLVAAEGRLRAPAAPRRRARAARRSGPICSGRASRARPAAVALVASLLIVPALLLPNPQDLVIQRDAQIRAEAAAQAQRIEDVAKDLEGKGVDPTDPRTQVAKDLRDLAQRLRERPGDLDLNLARVGALEGDVRAQLDPANEQRASSLAALVAVALARRLGRPEGEPGR